MGTSVYKGGASRHRSLSDNAQNTAKDFFKKSVSIVKLHDGTIITHRVTSSSDGTPAVSINITKSTDGAGIKIQKIHFVGKE